jgi:DNA polymerase-3 subunit beta
MVMKFTCSREELAQKLAVVSRATTGSGAMPVLGGIKITAANGATQDVITLEATNLEMTIRTEFGGAEIRILDAGQTVVHGKILLDMIKKMPGYDVLITIDDQKATIEAVQANGKTCKCNLPVFPVEEFPDTLSELSCFSTADDTIEIKSETFCGAIKKTAYATLRDDARPFKTSIKISAEEKHLTLVGTDTNRLAIYQTSLAANNAGDVSFIVPTRTLKEIEAIFDKDDDLSISASQQNMIVKTFYESGSMLFSARLINDLYPDYTRIIPRDILGRVKVNRVNFINTLERVNLISSTVVMSVKNIPYQTILVAGEEQDRGSIFDELSVTEMDGADIKIGFNIRFLLDYLKAVDCEAVEMRYQQALKSVAFENVDGDKKYLYIAMPVTLPESALALVA